jgi:hypothetical protein
VECQAGTLNRISKIMIPVGEFPERLCRFYNRKPEDYVLAKLKGFAPGKPYMAALVCLFVEDRENAGPPGSVCWRNSIRESLPAGNLRQAVAVIVQCVNIHFG